MRFLTVILSAVLCAACGAAEDSCPANPSPAVEAKSELAKTVLLSDTKSPYRIPATPDLVLVKLENYTDGIVVFRFVLRNSDGEEQTMSNFLLPGQYFLIFVGDAKLFSVEGGEIRSFSSGGLILHFFFEKFRERIPKAPETPPDPRRKVAFARRLHA